MTLLSVNDKVDSKTKRIITRDLTNEVNKICYFDFIPLNLIGGILSRYRVDPVPLDGVYCGRDGQSTAQIAKNLWVHLAWHKMEVSGKYEIVCYIS